MKPTKLTVSTLFEPKRRYTVPLFQRPYVWDQENQWQPLWQDIEDKADQIQENDGQSGAYKHFFGAVVINKKITYIPQIETYDIIDGQQRLTTLQVMLVAFRNFLRKNYAATLADLLVDLEKLTKNTGTMAGEIEKYKVWPTAADQKAFTAFVDVPPEPADKKSKLPTLLKAYHFFYRMIDEYVQYGETDDGIQSEISDYQSEISKKRASSLYYALSDYLEIVVIELEEGDDPQVIFETLNARGVPLLPSDLIRNFIFLQADRKREDVNQLYNNYWLAYDDDPEDFWKTEELQGRLKRPRIDLFIFHYLTLKTRHEIKIPNLFQEFRRWWDQTYKASDRVEEGLKDIQNYAKLYRRLIESDRETRLGIFMYRLKALDTSTLYPLILYLYGENTSLTDLQRQDIIVMLESYLVRRLVSGLSNKNYNKMFPQILRELRRSEPIDPSILHNLLIAFEGDAGRWPRDEEFQRQWRSQVIYYDTRPQRARMILEALDMQLMTKKQEKLAVQEVLSVEHIYPQTPDPTVWMPLTDENRKHTLGNLTLVTGSFNSSLGNVAFEKKRPDITHTSVLPLNVYFQDLAHQTTWTEEDILRRSDVLFHLALQIWPSP